MSLNAEETSHQHDPSSEVSHDEAIPTTPIEDAMNNSQETQHQKSISPCGDDPSAVETCSNDTDRPRGKSYNEHYEKFLVELEQLPDADAKLQFVIDFMEASLAQTGAPHFKTFWDARSLSLNLFKEAVNPTLRSALWIKYEELSKEARRLKEILDEQSSFAMEQFEIAIAALEAEIATFDEHLKKIPDIIFDLPSRILSKGLGYYEQLQKQLNLLNVQASRINALRKELIRTEMRVRQKNKFFQRLSAAGDHVFPRRKEMIKEVSLSFNFDIDAFIAAHFSDEQYHHSLFSLREEIKMLQGMAKTLTLNTHAFNHTRMQLSECWDKIKEVEKERKKERAQQKMVYKHNFDEGMKQLQEFNLSYESQLHLKPEEALRKLEELISHLRTLELGRDEESVLKEGVHHARKLIKDQLHSEEVQRQHEGVERDRLRRQKITDLKSQIERMSKGSESIHLEELTSQRDQILCECETLPLSKAEKQEFDRLIKPLRDLISEKKEDALLSLSDDDRQSLLQLKEVLKQKKERRQEIKEQISLYRKATGVSGLDFEQAMQMNEQVSEEKERLEKINQSIQEIETKLLALQRRL